MCAVESSCIGRPKCTTCLGSIRKRTLYRCKPSGIVFSPKTGAGLSKWRSEAIREKADFEVDFRIVLPDGPTRYVHSVGHPVVGDGGEVIELVGTHIDVTEQHLAKGGAAKSL